MRLSKSSFAALAVAIFAIFIIPSIVFAGIPKAARALEDGNKVAIEAQKSNNNVEQAEKFKSAIKRYDEAIKEGKPSGRGAFPSVEVAEAKLAKAKILAGMPIGTTTDQPFKKQFSNTKVESAWFGLSSKKVSVQNDKSARETFKQIAQEFPRSKTELVDVYTPEEATRVSSAVQQAVVYQQRVETRLDDTNRGMLRYQIIDFLVNLTGAKPAFSYWFALVLVAVIVKILITPLTKAQFKSMKEMQKISPLIKEIQEKHKGDQAEIGKRTMDLYKEHGINPLMGCLPLLAQFPVLLAVYAMIQSYEIHFAQGTFLWIGWEPLVHKWSWTWLVQSPIWVTGKNLAEPDLILLLLYTASMIVSQRISIVDPTQAEQQKMMSIMMPVMFFFIIGGFPSAFVFYWFIFNVLTTWQQYHIIHGGPTAEQAAAPVAADSTTGQRVARRRRRRR